MSTSNFSQCLFCQIIIHNVIGFIITTYCYSSHTADKFNGLNHIQKLLKQMEQLKQSHTAMFVEFNVR